MQHEVKSGKQKFLNKLSLLLSRYWKLVIIIPLLIVFLIAGATIYNIRKTDITEKSTAFFENIQTEYNTLRSESGDEIQDDKYGELIVQLDEIIEKYSSYYAGQRALFLKGDIYFEKKDYTKALETYSLFVGRYKDIYPVPIALNNMAVCYEETGDIDSAIKHHEQIVLDYKNIFPVVSYTYFSIGRLYEASENYAKASENYNFLINNYPDSDWTNLARNRIIYLKAADKI